MAEKSSIQWKRSESGIVHVLTSTLSTKDCRPVERLFADLDLLVSNHSEERWLIDLQGVVLVSSRAIAQLIATARKIHQAGGRMALINVHQFVDTVFRTMSIVKLVPIFELEREALDYLC